MTRTRTKTIGSLGIVLAVGALIAAQEDPTKKLMQAKTRYAHRLLDAVVQEDFETIRDQALRLQAVAETADWRVIETQDYVHESDAFIRATARLLAAAREENGDGVALAFMDVTLKCVQCHRYIKTQGLPRE